MPLLYIPLNISKCCEELKIPKNNTVNKYIYDIFADFYEESFCSFELIKGKNKNSICGLRVKEGKYCKRHKKFENNEKKIIIKKEKFHCQAKSFRRDTCGRYVKNLNELCTFHKNKNDTGNLDKTKRIKYLLNKFKFICLFIICKKKKKENIVSVEEIKTMKCIDIVDYIGIDYIRETKYQIRIKNHNQNIVVIGDKYCDNYNKDLGSGAGVFNFYMYITNKDFKSSIKDLSKFFISFSSCRKNNKLLNYNNIKKCLKRENNENNLILENNNNSLLKDNKNIIPEEKKENIVFVKEYLTKVRCINDKIIDKLIKDGNISADEKKNCIFYNLDKSYAFLRGIFGDYKHNAGIPNFIIYKITDNPLYLFESVIDLISYMDIIGENKKGTFVSTSGNMMMSKIDQLVTKEINEIVYCFDNDEQGRKNVRKIKEQYIDTNIIHTENYPKKGKDWNSE